MLADAMPFRHERSSADGIGGIALRTLSSRAMKTLLTDKFAIRHPIIQAPMNWATDARLVASVSAAGGLGTLGPNAGAKTPSDDPQITGERLRDQIRQVRAITDMPFAVNVPIGRGGARVFSDRAIEIIIAERVPIVIVATGSPAVYTARLKEALRRILADRRFWVKVSGGDRISSEGPPYHDALPFARTLVETFPDQVLWGTDWPHPNVTNRPDDVALMDLVPCFAKTETAQKALLVDNPARLYA